MRVHLTGYLAVKYRKSFTINIHSFYEFTEALASVDSRLKDDYKRMQLAGIVFVYVLNGEAVEHIENVKFKEDDVLYLIPIYTASFKFLKNIWKGVMKVVKKVFSVVRNLLGLKKKGTDTTTQAEEDDKSNDSFTSSLANTYGEGSTIPLVYGRMLVGSVVVSKSLSSVNENALLGEDEKKAKEAFVKVINADIPDNTPVTIDDLDKAAETLKGGFEYAEKLKKDAKLNESRIKRLLEMYPEDHTEKPPKSYYLRGYYLTWYVQMVEGQKQDEVYYNSGGYFKDETFYERQGKDDHTRVTVRAPYAQPYKNLLKKAPIFNLSDDKNWAIAQAYCKMAKYQFLFHRRVALNAFFVTDNPSRHQDERLTAYANFKQAEEEYKKLINAG